MSNLMLDVDQAGELKAAFRRGDWTNAEIKHLCEGDILARVREVVLGQAEITYQDHIIDLDADPFTDPFVPEGWKVEEHQKGGRFKWNPQGIQLYLSPNQQGEKRIDGYKIREELKSQKVLNVNVLDHLIAHPHLIPEDWKGKCVFFWGTIYRGSDGILYARYLDWDGHAWHWHYGWLGNEWSVYYPAAVSAS